MARQVELVEGERFQRARHGLAEHGVGREVEKLVDALLGPA